MKKFSIFIPFISSSIRHRQHSYVFYFLFYCIKFYFVYFLYQLNKTKIKQNFIYMCVFSNQWRLICEITDIYIVFNWIYNFVNIVVNSLWKIKCGWNHHTENQFLYKIVLNKILGSYKNLRDWLENSWAIFGNLL